MFSIDKNLKTWLETNKMWVRSDTDKEKTHNVMEYGMFLSIKDDFKEEFYRKLAKTLDEGKINYLLEIRTDYFKFMVDVDFKNELGLSNDDKFKLLTYIHKAVNMLLDDNHKHKNNMIVSTCKDEQVEHRKQQMMKIGFHLIWPDIIVSVDEALYLRSAIIQFLEQSDFYLSSLEDWETIIDKSLYDNMHALRMNGSSKNVICPECKGKSKLRNECYHCRRSGKINEGRIYYPYLIFDYQNNLDEKLLNKLIKDNYLNLIKTSIRTNATKTNIKIKFPEWFSHNKYVTHNKTRQRKSKDYKCDIFTSIKKENKEEISETDKRYKTLKSFMINELFKLSRYFDHIELDKLIKITDKKKCTYIFSTKSMYCLNMKREHSSNHIYFVIDKNNIYQKCPSPWKNSDDFYCCDFKSESLKINKELQILLFETEEIKNTISKQNLQKMTSQFEFFSVM